jgi:hypothetical protein
MRCSWGLLLEAKQAMVANATNIATVLCGSEQFRETGRLDATGLFEVWFSVDMEIESQ